MKYILLPGLFLKFWFFEAPYFLILTFYNFNKSLVNLLTLHLMVSTFFKPLKNEYREGLVLFSVLMGIIFKTVLIFTDVIILIFVTTLEFTLIGLFLLIPLFSFYLLFL